MFCKKCGKENKDYSLYCSNDGELLQGLDTSFNIVNNKTKFCKECGNSLNYVNNYCSSCGELTYEISEKNADEKSYNNVYDKKGIKDLKTLINIEKKAILDSAKWGIIGFGIISIFAFIISIVLKMAMKGEMDVEEFLIFKKMFNMADFVSIMNGISIKIGLAGGIADYKTNQMFLNISFGLVMFFLIPLITFTIIGAIMDKKDKRLKTSNMLIVSIVYGCLVAILSMFSGMNNLYFLEVLEEIIPFFNVLDFISDFSIKVKLSKLDLIIKAVFLSFLGLNIGTLLKGVKFKKDLNIRDTLDKSPKGSIRILGLGVLFSILLTFITKSEDLIEDLDNIFAVGTILFQLIIYVFLLINGGTFSFIAAYEQMEISLLDLDNKDILESFFNVDRVMVLYLGVLFVIFLFFLHGRDHKKNGSSILDTFLVPFYYALILGIISYIVKINVNIIASSFISENIQFTLSFSVIGVFIKSFILGIVGAVVGFLLTSEKNSKKVNVYE